MYQDSKMQAPPPAYSDQPPPVHIVHPPQVVGGGTTVITTTPIVGAIVVGQQVGPKPTHMTCKSCGAEIVSRVEQKATMRTHLFAALLCLIGCWPCVCIPYCTESCLNADHYCPNCNAYIGSYVN